MGFAVGVKRPLWHFNPNLTNRFKSGFSFLHKKVQGILPQHNKNHSLPHPGFPPPVQPRVFAGDQHSFLITSNAADGTQCIYAFGDNKQGQLGLGYFGSTTCRHNTEEALKEAAWEEYRLHGQVDTPQKYAVPTPQIVRAEILRNKFICHMDAGAQHTIFLAMDNHQNSFVYVCGSNERGQIGLGEDIPSVHTPEEILFFRNKKIVHGVVGADHTIIVTRDHLENDHIYTFGANNEGQLGSGDEEDRFEPQEILTNIGPKKVLSVAAGSQHTLFLMERPNGLRKVFVCGSNSKGQLSFKPNVVNANTPNVITTNLEGTLICVRAGNEHTLVITQNGSQNFLYACGSNSKAQLGLVDPYALEPWGDVIHSLTPLLALCGFNIDLITARGDQTMLTFKDPALGSRHAVAFGDNSEGQFCIEGAPQTSAAYEVFDFAHGNSVEMIAQGRNHTLIVAKDRLNNFFVFVGGSNENGQLGQGSNPASQRIPQVLFQT